MVLDAVIGDANTAQAPLLSAEKSAFGCRPEVYSA